MVSDVYSVPNLNRFFQPDIEQWDSLINIDHHVIVISLEELIDHLNPKGVLTIRDIFACLVWSEEERNTLANLGSFTIAVCLDPSQRCFNDQGRSLSNLSFYQITQSEKFSHPHILGMLVNFMRLSALEDLSIIEQ